MVGVKVSVVVLTCNRKEQLSRTLANVLSQSFTDKEVIVVDNGSTDGTYQRVREEFPDVIVLRQPSNQGCAARNKGIQFASGQIVVTLDDDVRFKDHMGLTKVVGVFEEENIAAICFRIWDRSSKRLAYNNWFHPRQMATNASQCFETDYISEGAAAFRRELFERVGCYPGDFFLGHEGYDLALRIINAGYRIVYRPSVEVVHAHSSLQRKPWRDSYYHTRNTIWLFLRNYPLVMIVSALPVKLLGAFIFSASQVQTLWFLRGLWHGLKGIEAQRQQRNALSPVAMARLKAIRSEMSSPVVRLREFFLKNRLRHQLREKVE